MSAPDRPLDRWRVCGRPVTDGPGRGCTCGEPRRRAPEPDPVEKARAQR